MRQAGGAVHEPGGGDVGRVVTVELADLVVRQEPRRAGPDHLLGPAVPPADVSQQHPEGPVRAGRHGCTQIRALDAGAQQLGLGDDLGAAAVVVHEV